MTHYPIEIQRDRDLLTPKDPSGSTKSGVTVRDGVTRGPEGSSDSSIYENFEKDNPNRVSKLKHRSGWTTEQM